MKDESLLHCVAGSMLYEKAVWAALSIEDHIIVPSLLLPSYPITYFFRLLLFCLLAFPPTHPFLHPIFLHFNTLITSLHQTSLLPTPPSHSFLPFSTLPLSHHITPSLACSPVSLLLTSSTPHTLPPFHFIVYFTPSPLPCPPNLSSPLSSPL